jgi:hypothetical protein
VALLAFATPGARADKDADRHAEIEDAFDHYTAAKTDDQRAAIIDFLQHYDRKTVAGALIDHIVNSRSGNEATEFNKLIEALSPDGCMALLDRLAIEKEAVAKGKLIVALRHCQGREAIPALAACLDDKRPVKFEAKTPTPRRVCDLAYDELYLKLRTNPSYKLDNSPQMRDLISEKTPATKRDEMIERLRASLGPEGAPSEDWPKGQ